MIVKPMFRNSCKSLQWTLVCVYAFSPMIPVRMWVQAFFTEPHFPPYPQLSILPDLEVFSFFLLVKDKEQSFMLDLVTLERTEGRKRVRCGQPGTCALGSKSPQRHLLYISLPPSHFALLPSFFPPSISILSDRLSAIAESRLSPNRILFLIWTHLFITKALCSSV